MTVVRVLVEDESQDLGMALGKRCERLPDSGCDLGTAERVLGGGGAAVTRMTPNRPGAESRLAVAFLVMGLQARFQLFEIHSRLAPSTRG